MLPDISLNKRRDRRQALRAKAMERIIVIEEGAAVDAEEDGVFGDGAALALAEELHLKGQRWLWRRSSVVVALSELWTRTSR